MGHRTCSSTMLLVVFLWQLYYFYPNYEFIFNFTVFLVMAAPQRLVLAQGTQLETIRYLGLNENISFLSLI